MQDAKRRTILFLVFALLLSAIAGFMFLQQESEVNAQLGDFVTVYVANKTIQPRTMLNPADFDAKLVPRKYVPESVLTDLHNVPYNGNNFSLPAFVSVIPLKKGDLLTTSMLKLQSELASPDKRVVMIYRSDKVGFDDVFNYGDLVDIIVTEGQGGNLKSRIYKKAVPVVSLATDGKNVSGLGLEMTLNEAADFINEQNTAVSIRILKAPNSEKINGSNANASAYLNNDQKALQLNSQGKPKLANTNGNPMDNIDNPQPNNQ